MRAWLSAHSEAIIAVAIVLVLIAIVVVALWYARRRRAASSAPAPTKVPSLDAAWGTFLRGLQREARGRPVAWVIGPTGSGKTSLITRGSLGDRIEAVSSDHPSVCFYAVRGWLVIELGWEAFRDVRARSVAELDALVRSCGWQSNALAVVLDASSPLSRDALGAIGEQVGALAARLERKRRAPVSVRVCWTHLDLEYAGFEPLSTAIAEESEALRDASHRVLELSMSAPMSASEAKVSFEPVASLWPYALQGAAFTDVLAFCSRGHERLTTMLVPFATAVVRRATERGATLDGVALAALPPSGPSTEFGDTLRADDASDAALRRARRVSWATRIAQSVVIALVLGALFGYSDRRALSTVDELDRRASAFATGASRATPAALDAQSTGLARELTDARALRASPRYRSAAEHFVDGVQQGYLRPLARQPDPARRAFALGLLRSRPGDATRRQIAAQSSAWSARTGVPSTVIDAYVAQRPGPVDVGPLSAPVSVAATWTQFERALAAAIDPPSLELARFEGARREAEAVRAADVSAAEDSATRELIASLRASGEPVDRWFASDSSGQSASTPAARALLEAVSRADLSTPAPSQPTLASLLRTTEPMLVTVEQSPSASAGADDHARAASAQDSAAPADASADGAAPAAQDPRIADWNRAVARLRSSSAIDAWLAARRASSDPMATFFVRGQCGEAFGQSAVPGRGAQASIPCEFDPAQFDAAVVRPRAQLAAALQSLSLPSAREADVSTFVSTEAIALETARGMVIREYVRRYAFRCDTVEGLASDFALIVGPGSYLRAYLSAISKTLSSTDAAAQGEFSSLVAIGATNAAGATPALDPLLEILRPMMQSISSIRPSVTPPNTPLAQRTAPIGTLALSMLQGGETSPWIKASAWLDSQGVPPRLREPMMGPIECAYRLGISEAERVLALVYGREIAPSARRLWARFPFESTAEQEADPADVEALFAPNGSFWTAVDASFSTVAEPVAAGRWRARRGPNGREFVLPPGASCALTRATRTRSALFTAEGARAPLNLDVHSAPLPLASTGYTPTMVTLRAGARSISAFNQAELWQRLAVTWGDGGNSGLLVHLLPVGGGAAQIVTMDRGPSDWSFHRLLAEGDNDMNRGARRVVTWSVRAPNGSAVRVSFEFRSDPWLPFLAPSGCEGAFP